MRPAFSKRRRECMIPSIVAYVVAGAFQRLRRPPLSPNPPIPPTPAPHRPTQHTTTTRTAAAMPNMGGDDGGPSSWDEVDDALKGYLSDTPPTGPFEAPEYVPDYSHCIVVDNLPKVRAIPLEKTKRHVALLSAVEDEMAHARRSGLTAP